MPRRGVGDNIDRCITVRYGHTIMILIAMHTGTARLVSYAYLILKNEDSVFIVM